VEKFVSQVSKFVLQFSQRQEDAVKREPENVAVSTPKKFTKNRCAEFYRHQIAEKLSLKFPLCIANLVRLMQAVVVVFLVRLPVFVQPRKKYCRIAMINQVFMLYEYMKDHIFELRRKI